MMKYLRYFLLFPIILLNGCETDDDINCALFDPAPQLFFIELLDNEGNNLIENGTFNANDIVVRFNDFEFTQVVFNEVEELQNLISISLLGDSGDNTYEIVLSETETDTLVLNLSVERQTCGARFFNLNTATYNEEPQTIIEDDPLLFGASLIRVVR